MNLVETINKMYGNTSYRQMYEILTKKYMTQIIDLYMYDLFRYTHNIIDDDNTRIHQNKFRIDLIKRYGECIVTGTDPEICEACHIVPHNICNQYDKYNIDNGLLLRSDLHKLFDNGKMKIDPNTKKVIFDSGILNNSKMHEIYKFHNKEIHINRNTVYYLKKIYK